MKNNLPIEILDKLRFYSKKCPNEEVCGFIIEKNGFLDFLSVDNKHPDKRNFALISPKDYLNIKKENNILYHFHSHVSGSCFSEIDLFYQKYHNINMILYDVNEDLFKESMCKI